jgi:hypothetical protein
MNEIELSMVVTMIESHPSEILQDKGNTDTGLIES